MKTHRKKSFLDSNEYPVTIITMYKVMVKFNGNLK